KLSNLVDNTDDLNNYDAAIDRLRKERSKYQKLRGSGGSIDDIQDNICKLAKELFEAENKKPLLIEATKDVEKLNAQTVEQDNELAVLRDKITKASKQKGDKVIREQFLELEKDLTLVEENIDSLNKLYPKGYPKKEEIVFNNKRVLAIEHAEKSLSELVIKDEDIECEAKWREVFADEDITSNDIRARIISIPSSILKLLPESMKKVKVLFNNSKAYTLNIDKSRRYLGGVTEILREHNLLSVDNVITPKNAKWHFNEMTNEIKILIEN
ncbi:hypothetical protein, partial [uncultured Haemophilus sp.]|uniref:hypothetical protein n=1 Tax=uncultured Haemophilus sp. TaxID=237779 RepID=UPI002633B22C